MLPKPRSSPAPDDIPTPNISEYIKSIPSWSPEEQLKLEENMKKYPASENAEFKRLTLLMTDLPNKRLRDVSLRVKYIKARETQDISWDVFLQNSFGQQKVEHSASHSLKSPRATPIEKETKKKSKRSSRKKENDQLSLSHESNNQLSVNSTSYRDRETSMTQTNTTNMNMNYQITQPQMGTIQFQQYQREAIVPQHYQQPIRQPVMYAQRERIMVSTEEQTCTQLINENERWIEFITNAILHRSNDLGDSVAAFHANIKQILMYSEQLAATVMPPFCFQPMSVQVMPVHKFRKIEMPGQEQLRVQQFRNDFQLNGLKNQRDEGRRQDLL